MKNETEDIHKTFPDENEPVVSVSKNPESTDDDVTRQNFVTDVPPVDDDDAKPSAPRKSKTGMLVAFGLFGVIILFGLIIAVYFISRGNSKETAVVKDNSPKLGINANTNSSSDQTNFQDDYTKRYGSDSNSAANVATGGIPSANSANSSVTGATAPPTFNPTGGIYQIPNPATPTPTPTPTPNSGQSSGGGSSSSGSFGRSSSGASGESSEMSRVNVNPNTRFTEISENTGRSNSQTGRNDQVSLYFYDASARQPATGQNLSRVDLEYNSPVKPSFGTLLPVRLLGRLHTLGTNGFARLELTRTVQGNWGTLPSGTLFVGRVAGGEANRVFVSLIGYIDPRSGRLVTLGGDLQGTDGALGMKGDVKKLGSRWSKVFSEVLNTAKEIGSSYLLGRSGGNGTIINNGQLDAIPNALENKDAQKFTLVSAGSIGYIFINDLPPAFQPDERLGTNKNKTLTDEEILKMIQTNSDQDLQKIIPGLSTDGQLIARKALQN